MSRNSINKNLQKKRLKRNKQFGYVNIITIEESLKNVLFIRFFSHNYDGFGGDVTRKIQWKVDLTFGKSKQTPMCRHTMEIQIIRKYVKKI